MASNSLEAMTFLMLVRGVSVNGFSGGPPACFLGGGGAAAAGFFSSFLGAAAAALGASFLATPPAAMKASTSALRTRPFGPVPLPYRASTGILLSRAVFLAKGLMKTRAPAGIATATSSGPSSSSSSTAAAPESAPSL